MSNSKQATNSGEGNEDTVYHFVREMIREKKCAWFVDKNGLYRVKWEDIVKRHIKYREKKKGGNTLNITWKKASNNLRESLLRRYCNDGAKEYEERQTLGKKRKIVEREFQMPHEVFRKLFVLSEIQLPGDENRRVVVDPPDEETPFEIAGLSSEDIDTILEENANNDGDQPEAAVQYNGSSSGSIECETSRISASDLESTQEVQSLLQLVEDPDYEIAALFSEDVLKENANNDGDQAGEVQSLLQFIEDPDYEIAGLSSEDIDTTLEGNANDDGNQPEAAVQYNGSSSGPKETFATFVKEFYLALEETCSNSGNYVDQRGVVQAIHPSEGPMEGGAFFFIVLVEELLESDTKVVAHFEKIGDVVLKKASPWGLFGIVPAAKEAGTVLITVFTEAGRKLGTAYFTYEDVTEEEEYLKSRYGHWLTPFRNRWKQ